MPKKDSKHPDPQEPWVWAIAGNLAWSRCVELLNTGILHPKNAHDPHFIPSITYLLVELNELLKLLAKTGVAVSADRGKPFKTYSDLIKHCRDAAVHLTSGKHYTNLKAVHYMTWNFEFDAGSGELFIQFGHVKLGMRDQLIGGFQELSDKFAAAGPSVLKAQP